MLDRDLITERAPGRGVEALVVPAPYKLSTRLRVLLGAGQFPAFMIATHRELRTPAATYFQPWGPAASFGRSQKGCPTPTREKTKPILQNGFWFLLVPGHYFPGRGGAPGLAR